MSDQKEPEREWLGRIVARMDRASSKLPEPYWLSGEWPAWVTNVGRELSKALFPTAKLEGARDWKPGEVGALLGQQMAYGAIDLASAVKAARVRKVPWKKLRATFGKDIRKRVEMFGKKFDEEFIPDRMRAFKFAMGLAIEQNYHDSARFFAAFGRALQRKPSTASDIGRTNTQIYIVLLIYWRSVQGLSSIRELHGGLCKIFGTHLVGDVKRIEKMCQRLDLHFRPPGRPKKARIQTD